MLNIQEERDMADDVGWNSDWLERTLRFLFLDRYGMLYCLSAQQWMVENAYYFSHHHFCARERIVGSKLTG